MYNTIWNIVIYSMLHSIAVGPSVQTLLGTDNYVTLKKWHTDCDYITDGIHIGYCRATFVMISKILHVLMK